ncbi:MAG TPA: DUF4136 domain-containing protein [Myxococcaceae bacterium]|nr:DUF4136 domain-containing protein [Myxococcaceae bacterium]
MSRVGKSLAPPVLGVGLLLAACHPTGVETITDLDVVATTHNAGFDFAAPNTYSLPSAIFLIQGDPTITPPQRIDPVLEQLVLSTLKTELDASGYTQVGVGKSPDLAVNAAALMVTNVNYYYGYWCTYWTYYGCYPYYPPVVGVSTYVVGTLLVDMVPFSATPPGNQYVGVWTAVIRGIQTGSRSTDQQRVVNGISQAFIQSPYLGKR